jgi:YesN/AraC family two-component response regulator
MKEKALFLLVLGYILSFLAIKDIFFLILNIVVLIILIIKKKNYKFYLIGVLFLCLRLIFINNNYNLDVNEKFLVVLNKENYSIIMNTLLRKAAENGGVHPVYLDKTSSDFAHKIEMLPSASKVTALMQDMFRTYCRLVRRHNLKKYSPVVQKTILTIDSDLSADLGAKTLAQSQNVSLGYLSAIFRKEVGLTLSSYVRQKRMEHAKYLLSRTELQVQSVALHCGILDVVYFTKSFKREVGMTPSEYRAAQKSSEQA